MEDPDYWNQRPAFLIAITLLFGVSAPLFWSFPWNFFLPSLWGFYLIYLRSWGYFLLMPLAAFYSFLIVHPVKEGDDKIGLFSISSLQPHVSPFHKGLIYKGTLYIDGEQVPCSAYYKGNLANHPLANCDYILKGKLFARNPNDYAFKAKEWGAVPSTFSLAEIRYRLKERFKVFLEENLSPRCATLLSSLTTGDVEDRLLRYEFSRVGLQHLLAISGFHFAILLSMCTFICGRIFPRKVAIVFLLIGINAYFFFVGSSPAVQRSWFIAQLYLLAECLNRNSSSLNLLGCGCILEILLDPRVAGNIGFQLSFLSTGGILLFSPIIETFLRRFFPKRNANEIRSLDIQSKLVYLLAAVLRRSISLNLAINLSILPLLLYHFHNFPLLSMFYNLFVPFLVSIALFILCASFLIPYLFPLCDFLTRQILDLVSHPPLILDRSIRTDWIECWMIPIYLLMLLFTGMALKKSSERFS